jgi:hypothetical protein
MEISLPLGRSMMTGSQFEMPHERQDIKPIFASLSTSASVSRLEFRAACKPAATRWPAPTGRSARPDIARALTVFMAVIHLGIAHNAAVLWTGTTSVSRLEFRAACKPAATRWPAPTGRSARPDIAARFPCGRCADCRAGGGGRAFRFLMYFQRDHPVLRHHFRAHFAPLAAMRQVEPVHEQPIGAGNAQWQLVPLAKGSRCRAARSMSK